MNGTSRTLLCAVLAFAFAGISGAATTTDVRTMLDVWDDMAPGVHGAFALTGTVHTLLEPATESPGTPAFVLDDGELLVSVFNETRPPVGLRPGDRVAAAGIFGLKKFAHGNEPYAVARDIRVLGAGDPVRPTPRTLADLSSLRDNLRRVRTIGKVIDWRMSEDDPDYICLTLKDGPTTMPVFVQSRNPDAVAAMLESHVSVVGTFNWALPSVRRYARPLIASRLQDIEVVSPPPPPESIPTLERKIYLPPEKIRSLDRRRVEGEIIAVWKKSNLLVRDDDGRVVRVKLSHRNRTTPRTGQLATVFGYPETDQFNIILGTATIESVSGDSHFRQMPVRIESISGIIDRTPGGTVTVNPSYYGTLITLAGAVRSLPSPGNDGGLIRIECDGHLVELDASTCPEAAQGLELGCRIEATGVCLLEADDYDAQTDMPHIRGLTLILRDKGDIVVLSRRPWLTAGRFLVILGAMAGALALVLVWNVSLRILAQRRGHELAHRQVEAAQAKLKTIERTRLAAELHDSVVQNLTGAALEIRAAMASLPAASADPHLAIAVKAINSTRSELRNCIWDLRSRALETSDIDEAVRITLQPHLGDVRLVVRFDVPRRLIPDDDFHDILCIVRELAVNAVRHGRAATVWVEGRIGGGRIAIRVEDDGCGFDPATRPGMEQGHFGLEGVAERVKSLGGDFKIASAQGCGTKVLIDIPVHKETPGKIIP